VLTVSDVLVFLRKIPDNSVNLVIADPPYYKIAKEAWDHQWDTPDEYLAWCKEWLDGDSKNTKTWRFPLLVGNHEKYVYLLTQVVCYGSYTGSTARNGDSLVVRLGR
jgi:hypothetical protein